ncbi:hypothetical protein [Mesomycoplasma ovipneumoniae]|uniref:hypothetical protein n=1 Tax=Mesomycoplasma ovipneumoniae TaxID=29562 RepID=UPI00311B1924
MDIVELEFKNLTQEQKEGFYELLKSDQEFKNFDNSVLDKILVDSYRYSPDLFINFQKSIKNSLYNQALNKNDFKDLGYEDVVQNLTLKQKEKVVHDIISLVKNLKDEDGYSYDVEPYIMKNTNRVWEYFKKIENKESNEVWEQRKNKKYVLVLPNNNNKKGGVGFFKNDEELILFALSKKELAHKILFLHEKYLNPHYEVNQWIVTNQKLESTQTFEKPKLKMPSIVQLELKNFPNEYKEELYSKLSRIQPNQKWENFKNYSEVNKMLEDYFKKYPDEFIYFQGIYKDSLYRQAIQKNDFKQLDFKDVVQNLTQNQKDEIIWGIRATAKHLKDENGNDYADEPRIIEITDDYREAIEEIQAANEDKREWLEENKNNKYILILPTNKEDGNATFFKNDDELILFALNNQTLAPGLLKFHWKTLDPHLKVNQWIEKNYESELTQKHNSKQTKKLKQPKKKM